MYQNWNGRNIQSTTCTMLHIGLLHVCTPFKNNPHNKAGQYLTMLLLVNYSTIIYTF